MNGKIDSKNIEDVYSLSNLQQGILYHYLKDNSTLYNLQYNFKISGEINIDYIKQSWNLVIKNNEVLRTIFRWKQIKKPVQIVLKENNLNFDYIDSTKSNIDPEIQINELETLHRTKRWDLEKNPFNVILIKIDVNNYKLIINSHHIIIDGWSFGIIIKEFLENYDSQLINVISSAKNKTKFKEFVKHEVNSKNSEHNKFWKKYLDGKSEIKGLPAKNENSVKAKENGSYKQICTESLLGRLNTISKENKVSVSSVLYYAWGLLLNEYYNSNDIVFGTTISGRNAKIKGIENVVGLFINTIPLRIKIEEDKRLIDNLSEINKILQSRQNHELTPFSEIKKNTEIEKFESIVVVENYPIDKSIGNFSGFKFEFENAYESTSFDLTLIINLFEDNIGVNFLYNQEKFDEQTIKHINEIFNNILELITNNVNLNTGDLIQSRKQKLKEIISGFNNTEFNFPKDKTVLYIFEEQVKSMPDAIALTIDDELISYAELNRKSNQLADLLIKQGVQNEMVVGIMLLRSLEMIISILGILKARGAYLPIDPNYPIHRISYVLKDSNAKTLITSNIYENKCNDLDISLMNINNAFNYSYNSNDFHASYLKPTDLAYIIYTSGSTGNPKGVMIEHKGLSNRLNWMKRNYDFTKENVFLQKTIYTFDVSVVEIFFWSLAGAKLCLLKPDEEKDPKAIVDTIQKYKISHIHFVPSMLQIFLEYVQSVNCVEKLKKLKYVYCSGEELKQSHVKLFTELLFLNNGTHLLNLYGPTEASIEVAYYQCTPVKNEGAIPIGKPIDNINLFVINKQNELQQIGAPGELCISNVGLARGYINRPDLTSEKFVMSPFKEDSVMYKTGDLAKWLPDGNIMYLDRMDYQVKLRGFRIELGEIENQLLNIEPINSAVVLLKSINGSKQLCAYIVTNSEIDDSSIQAFLKKQLPYYMIPQIYIRLDNLPVTPNGKLNRAALPEATIQRTVEIQNESLTNVEKDLIQIWENVLNLSNINVNDNYFRIGGDSLKTIQIVSNAFQKGYELQVNDIIEYPTISELAKQVTEINSSGEKENEYGEINLSPIQKWFFDSNYEYKDHFSQSILIEMDDSLNYENLDRILNIIYSHHDVLRSSFNKSDNVIYQNIHKGDYPLELNRYEINDSNALIDKIKEIEKGLISYLNLNQGSLIKVGVIKSPGKIHLLIVIHHSIIDSVSWRILIQDIDTLITQHKNGQDLKLSLKTDSYLAWITKLNANTKYFKSQYPYWKKIESNLLKTLPSDFNVVNRQNLVSDSKSHTINLNNSDTLFFKNELMGKLDIGTMHALLFGFGKAIKEVFNCKKIILALESHGRSGVEGINLSRTVGWFTSIYPYCLTINDDVEWPEQLLQIVNSLNEVPSDGIGHSFLKNSLPGFELNFNPNVIFNYLGDINSNVDFNNFRLSDDISYFTKYNKNGNRLYELEIVSMISNNELSITAIYNQNQYKKETIHKLLQSYKVNLVEFIEKYRQISDVTLINSINSKIVQKPKRILDSQESKNIIKRAEKKEYYNLSPGQERIFLHQQKYEEDLLYNSVIFCEIEKGINIEKLNTTFQALIKRHEVLRTSFKIINGIPRQIIEKEVDIKIDYTEIKELNINDFIEENVIPFNLKKAPLLRIKVIKDQFGKFYLFIDIHHIISDGLSYELLIRDLNSIYKGEACKIGSLKYIDYTEWLLKQSKTNSFDKRYEKLVANLMDIKELKLPYDYEITDTAGLSEGRAIYFSVKDKMFNRLKELLKENETTLYTFLATVYKILLFKYSGDNSIVIGTTNSGRNHPDLLGIVGMFVNISVVKSLINENEIFEDLLGKVRQNLLESIKNQDLQYEVLIRKLYMRRKQHIDNLFNTVFTMDNINPNQLKDRNRESSALLKLAPFELEKKRIPFNLIMGASEADNSADLYIAYSPFLFKENTIIKLSESYLRIVEQILENPKITIGEISILNESQVLADNQLKNDEGGFSF